MARIGGETGERGFRTGVCWYPEQWPERMWRSDVERMRDLGIRVARLGEFAWSRLQPSRGEWRDEWLRRALDLLHEFDLRAILGTPSAAPPRWLLDEFPDMALVDERGQPAAFGSRRFACLAHAGYVRACVEAARRLARSFGRHPAVCGWQIDNEYGCHGTAFSHSAAASALFRRWLKRRYGSIAALNEAWGAAFWSEEYGSFGQLSAPLPTPAGHNPALLADFRRFWTERIALFNDRQARAVRRHSPGRDVVHDFMGFFTDFDHFEVAAGMDAAAWNSYPLGFLARFGREEDRRRYMRAGHPDHAAFHHDLYRACGRGRFWVTEQQPGPVNWAPYNPDPAPGMVRLWTLEAFAHGAEMAVYFRWRQAARGQEQMHAGLFCSDDSPAPAAAEAKQAAREIEGLHPEAFAPPRAEVALVFDYESMWMAEIEPHGDLPPLEAAMDFYSALRRAGADVDIVSAGADFRGYRLVVAPLLCAPPADFADRLRAAGCAALFGPRAGSKTAEFAAPPGLPPGSLRDLLGLTVLRVDSLPPEISAPVFWGAKATGEPLRSALGGAEPHASSRWREIIRPHGARALAVFEEDGRGAVFECDGFFYLACRPGESLLDAAVGAALRHARVATAKPPPDARARRRGDLTWIFNYGACPATPHLRGEVVVGKPGNIPPFGAVALRSA